MLFTIAKVFIGSAIVIFILLLILNIIYSVLDKRRKLGGKSHKDKTYKSTKSLMKDNSTPSSRFPAVLHYDESKMKGGKGSDL